MPAKTAPWITDRLSDALDAFGDGLRVLDEVGDRINDAGNDDLVGIEREVLQHRIFVCMARVGERQHEAADIQLAQDRHDPLQFNVAVVRPLECGAKVGACGIDRGSLGAATAAHRRRAMAYSMCSDRL